MAAQHYMTRRLGEGFNFQKPSNRSVLIWKISLYLITIKIEFTNFGTWDLKSVHITLACNIS